MTKIDTLNKWLAIAQQFAPLVLASLPVAKAAKIAPFVPQLVQTIQDVEQTAAAGSDKKATVLAALADGVATANAAGAHLDAAELAAIASPAIDTTIQVVNSIHALHATAGVPPPTA